MNAKMKAIIFDLDGTLALMTNRGPYGEDQAKCLEDTCREPLAEIARAFDAIGYAIILVSGRFSTYRNKTIQWLNAYNIPFDFLYMRDENDTSTPDTTIKSDIYLEQIEPYFHVEMVFDDRPKVIRMWRSFGLFVADVGDGKEF